MKVVYILSPTLITLLSLTSIANINLNIAAYKVYNNY